MYRPIFICAGFHRPCPSSEGQSLLVYSETETDLYSSIHKFILSIFFHDTLSSKNVPICIISCGLKRAKIICIVFLDYTAEAHSYYFHIDTHFIYKH